MNQNREFVKELCNLEIPSDINISPSGEHVLYATSLTWGHLKGKHSVTTLWLASLNRDDHSKQITDGTYRDHSLAWHPVRDEFAFVSDRAGNRTASAIYTMSIAEIGKVVPVTLANNEQAIEKFKFSPDGNSIAFISKDEKTEEEKRCEKEGEDVQVWGQEYKYSRLRIINLQTGATRTLALDQQVLDFCWIHDVPHNSENSEIAFVSCESTVIEHAYWHGTDINVVDVSLQHTRKLCSLPNRANDLSWGYSEDGNYNRLYFWSGERVEKNFCGSALYEVDIDKRPCEYNKVIFNDNENITAIRSVGDCILVKVQTRFEDRLTWVGTAKPICSFKQEIEAFDVVFGFRDEQLKIIVATSNVQHPVEVFLVDPNDGRKTQLSSHGELFQGQTFGECSTLSCLTTDVHKIEIDGLYLRPTPKDGSPENVTSEPCPTVVLIHGGPNTRVTNSFNTLYYMWTPYLLSLGYGVLLPNYRGSSGRGEEFASFSYGGVGVHEYADVIALTQHSIEKGYADPDKLVVGGYSHGGLIANLCALRNGFHGHGWTFKAAILGASISDIDTMALTSDMGNAYQAELHNGASPWTMSSADTSTRRASALWSLKEAMDRSRREGIPTIPPILIFHGANDERIHVSQAWGMQRALEHYSLPFEMAIYPRQGHVFHEQFFWIDMALRVGEWTERYIGPRGYVPMSISERNEARRARSRTASQ